MKPIGMRPQPVLSLALLALFAALMSGAQKPPAPAEKAGGPAREIASPAAAAPVPKTAVQDAALFERDVVPIFAAHCFKCHGLEARKADLDLRTPALIERGGKTGPPVVPGSAEKSLLFQKVSTAAMPPGNEIKLSAEQIGILRRWIDGGARAARAYGSLTKAEAPPVTAQDRMFWSFRKPVEPPLPRVRGRNRVRAPIDRFLLAKLEEKGLTFSKDTDRATLIRRASFDLTGLPPAPGEVDAFVADSSPGAYERLLDRLLASPHFGERWGRHWLDAAGYADTMGGDNDAGITKVGQGKWRYRDYVVRSLNQDKPWDQFLTEQIAGDELVDWRSAKKYTPEIQEKLIATGFLRTAYDDTDENELNTADLRLAVVQRLISNLSGSVLGLTVGCAQCHTHKYDPIPQRDYYQIMAIFSPAYNHQSWLQPKDRLMVEVSPGEKAEIDRHNAEIDRQIEPLKKQVAAIRQAHENRLLDEKLLQAPEEIRLEIKAALKTPREKRSMLDKFLLDKFEKKVKVAEDEVTAAFSPEEKARIASLEADMKPYEVKRAALGNIHAVYDVGPPMRDYLLRRGNHLTPAAEVLPGFLEVLTEPGKPFTIQDLPAGQAAPPAGSPAAAATGRRLAFARWLTDRDSPAGGLVGRVAVNRAWQHLFGEGMVATPDNFGRSGAPPANPELLDWLTVEFSRQGWRLKPLIRLIMTSTAYRQSSEVETGSKGAAAISADPANKLLWRMRLRRLEAEIIRDRILAASGKLNLALGGPSVLLDHRPDGMVILSEKDTAGPDRQWRRSLYILSRRNYHHSFLAAFDQPMMNLNCTRRNSSAVVGQALFMLNDDFVREQSREFARRVAATAGPSSGSRVARAFELAFSRKPAAGEAAWGEEFLARRTARHLAANAAPEQAAERALASFCHVLLNASEFLYVN
ncbi:MAG: DUF1553 domain-containing protein [Acidobacteria bacterium]|nr:DUF1553 domain-containing protein [Acidobacteriota bacterium]